MPTPDRTSVDAIVTAARELLEEDGLAGVTMQAVAERVGVRAPSLYKRVESRSRLIQLVAEATLGELAVRVEPEASILALANSLRTFSKERPAAFQLVMTPPPGAPVARAEFGARASDRLLQLTRDLVGERHALEAARTITAWAAGFISMELNGGFNLGGDVEDAWAFGATRIVAALGNVDE
jgi:AcrR family transcriptional regulator